MAVGEAAGACLGMAGGEVSGACLGMAGMGGRIIDAVEEELVGAEGGALGAVMWLRDVDGMCGGVPPEGLG